MAERLRRSESGNAIPRGKGKYPICIFAVATAFDGACEAFGYCIEVSLSTEEKIGLMSR